MLLITHEDADGVVYGISHQVYYRVGGIRDRDDSCVDCSTRGSAFIGHKINLCNRLIVRKRDEQNSEWTQNTGWSFPYPGPNKIFTLKGFLNKGACNVIQNYCAGTHASWADPTVFDGFTLDYVVQMKNAAGNWLALSAPMTFTDDPKLQIDGSIQLATYYSGPIDFRICADGASCTKNSPFQINYIDNCSSHFNWVD